jgi:carbamoyltransferase
VVRARITFTWIELITRRIFMTVILGFNAYHADSAACVVIDGVLAGAIAEERLGNRIKHSSAFPKNAINRILSVNGLKMRDVTHVAVPRDPKANYGAKMLYVAKRAKKSAKAVLTHIRRNQKSKGLKELLAEVFDEDPATLNFQLVEVEHHLAHVASAYYLSPYDSLTAGFSFDGSGDFASMMAAKCEGNKIEVIDRVTLPHSLGFFYTAMCQYIGFEGFGEEYKVMGLAPYGEDNYKEEMSKLVYPDDSSWFKLNTKYFGMHEGGESGATNEDGSVNMERFYTDKVSNLFGGAPRGRKVPLTQREMDIAKSTQRRFEDLTLHCINKLHNFVPSEQLVMAGGCALNGVTNAKILKETPFSQHFLQPASSDDGTCLGAAYYVWHEVLNRTERFEMTHCFWGPGYGDARIKKVAQESGFLVKECEDQDELVESTAKYLADGRVLGWYQEQSEWGPRALGHRSILASPMVSTMKEIINAKIKRRESFRPFAPSVLKNDVSSYFEQVVDSPFMMHVIKFKKEWSEKLPAVAHVDGTGRIQTVDEKSNELYFKLITKFKSLTGVGILLNTSFNENEPIVDTPEQAFSCFERTDMDVLCMGNYILAKPEVS